MFEHQHNEINKWQQLKSLFPIQSRQRQKLEYPKPDKLKSGGSATLHCSPICKKNRGKRCKIEDKNLPFRGSIKHFLPCHPFFKVNIKLISQFFSLKLITLTWIRIQIRSKFKIRIQIQYI